MAKKEYPIAKITRPNVARVLHRKRLFRHLDQSREQQILWMSAPAGSGKTTLAKSYLDSRKLPCLWYQLDARDADVATFFYYLGLAAAKAIPREYDTLPLFTAEYLQGLSAFTRNFFEKLYSQLNYPFVIVFDNYQEVPRDAKLHEVFREALTIVPSGLTIMVLSREAPAPTFARFQVEQTLAVLGWEDLRLNLEEATGIMKLHSESALSENRIQLFHEKTMGWAAGLILLLKQNRLKDLDAQSFDSASHEVIFDYFAGEIFQRTDEQTRMFLMQTALLPKITVSAAEKLTGMSQAGHLLKELSRKNYFTVEHHGVATNYEYHPLFRAFLLEQAEGRLTQEHLTLLRRTAANLLADENEVEAAVALAIQVQDWDLFSSLIVQHAQNLLKQGRYKTVHGWIESVPDERRDHNPWLLFWLAASLQPFDLCASRSYYEQAYHHFKMQHDVSGVYLAWAGVVGTYFYEWSDFAPLDYWIDEQRELRRRYPTYPSPEIENRVAIGIFCALMYRQPADPQLMHWEERVKGIVQYSSDISLRVMVGHHLLLYYLWWTGDRGKVRQLLAMLRPVIQGTGIPPLALIGLYSIEAASLWGTAAQDECMKAVNKGLEIAQSSGVHAMDFMLYAQGTWGALTSGNFSLAREFLCKIESILDKTRYLDASHYHFHEYFMAWHKGDVQRASEHAKYSYILACLSGSPWGIAVTHLEMGRALYEQGDRERAMDHLAKSRSIARTFQSEVIEYFVSLAETVIALDTGEEEEYLAPLRRFMALGRKLNYVNHIWWRPQEMIRLCVTSLEHNIEVDYVQYLIRKRQLVPDTPPRDLENWPWAIKIYTLGSFEIIREGKPLRFSGKVQQKPLSLLKALVAFGGNNVAEDQLTSALWPDADGDQAHKSLEVTLLRLRRLLNTDKGIQLREGKLTLDRRYCWVDAWAFEQMVAEAEQDALPGGDLGRSQERHKKKPPPPATRARQSKAGATVLEKILAIYRGNFLPGDTAQSWSISFRERLRSKFIRTILKLGDQLERAGQFEKAVECYQKGLDVDGLAEEFYQRLMICCKQLGQQAEGVAAYRRCHSILSSRLGLTPSSRTETIYKTLTDHSNASPLGGV